ncbi:MAG: phasin-family protein [Lysobacterales bacterium CG17_big_fil_post_rev_8_21_14_2_50_64_11]|nr:MAG: phasin-family protein [Xanthomonadales bacterium CG17_big_fil_post_rev_8_21_14_2_50_64_11]PIX59254.1 MAG: phasin-family protein [Xanthomonadales bacterium CG_4_10_14_3_um_filter_64_11]
MYEQINNQFSQFAQFGAFGKQFAEAALKANALAFDNVEKTLHLQIKTLEERLNATVSFVGEAAEAQDAETLQALLPRGLQLAKDNAERFFNASQEAYGNAVKTQEAIGQIVRGQFEAAAEQAKPAPAKAAKAK